MRPTLLLQPLYINGKNLCDETAITHPSDNHTNIFSLPASKFTTFIFERRIYSPYSLVPTILLCRILHKNVIFVHALNLAQYKCSINTIATPKVFILRYKNRNDSAKSTTTKKLETPNIFRHGVLVNIAFRIQKKRKNWK